MGGWVGRKEGRKKGRKNGRTYRWIDERKEGRMEGGWMNGKTDG